MLKKLLLFIAVSLIWGIGITYAQTPTETPTPSATPDMVTIRILPDRDSLVVAVPLDRQVRISGFEMQVFDANNNIISFGLSDSFSILNLTNGVVEAGSCLVYRLAGSTNPLPSTCSRTDRIFRLDVARSDVFWYDSVLERPRDIAVYRDGVFLSICSSAVTACDVSWEVTVLTPTPTATPSPTATSVPPINAADGRPHLSVTAACFGTSAVFYLSNMGASMKQSVQWTLYVNGNPFTTGSNPPIMGGLQNLFIYKHDSVSGAEVSIEFADNGEVVLDVGSATITCPPVGNGGTTAQPATATSGTRGYPCEGQIVFTTGALINQVKVSPQRNSPSLPPIQQGSQVSILAKQQNDAIMWYKISYSDGKNTGWIPSDNVIPGDLCPVNQ